jgi:hypothetical protein
VGGKGLFSKDIPAIETDGLIDWCIFKKKWSKRNFNFNK